MFEELNLKLGEPNQGAVAFKSSEKMCFTCQNPSHIASFYPNHNDITQKAFFKKIAVKCPSTQNKEVGLNKIQHITCKVCRKINHASKDCYFQNKNCYRRKQIYFLARNTD